MVNFGTLTAEID